MKKAILFVPAALMLLITSCNNSAQNVSELTQTEVTGKVEGLWTVTKFQDDNDDYTNAFSDWTFDFRDDGTLLANAPSQQYTGIWFVQWDDDRGGYYELHIQISGTYHLDEMTEDWYFTSLDKSRMELYDDNLLQQNDILIFEKK